MTVYEIAGLLKVNPETVRRWVRNGEMSSECSSKKTGNVISQEALYNFCKKHSKYMALAYGNNVPVNIKINEETKQYIKQDLQKRIDFHETAYNNYVELAYSHYDEWNKLIKILEDLD